MGSEILIVALATSFITCFWSETTVYLSETIALSGETKFQWDWVWDAEEAESVEKAIPVSVIGNSNTEKGLTEDNDSIFGNLNFIAMCAWETIILTKIAPHVL